MINKRIIMDKKARIFVSGHKGMVGSCVLKLLEKMGYDNLITKSSKELDLRNQKKVDYFIKAQRPDYVFLFAAKVGGIKANMEHPAEFLYDNLMIEANIINASYKYNVKKLLYLGSSCIYPRDCPQPMKEEYLLSGKFEPTNEGYALAKVAGLKLCEYYNKQFHTNFICIMPPNLYGPNDNFDIDTSHVLPALIRKFIDAKANGLKKVVVWGTGIAKREFLYVEDLAYACIYFMNKLDVDNLPSFVNIGSGEDVTIKELAGLISREIKYKGEIAWDTSMADGMPKKLLDLALSNKFYCKVKTPLKCGIRKTVKFYMDMYYPMAKKF